jgi:hypothetical protein
MSAILKDYIKAEALNQGFKSTEMNEKLFTAIAVGVEKYLNANVLADVTNGSSSGKYKLITS